MWIFNWYMLKKTQIYHSTKIACKTKGKASVTFHLWVTVPFAKLCHASTRKTWQKHELFSYDRDCKSSWSVGFLLRLSFRQRHLSLCWHLHMTPKTLFWQPSDAAASKGTTIYRYHKQLKISQKVACVKNTGTLLPVFYQ